MTKLISFAALIALMAASGAAHAEVRRVSVLNETITYADAELVSDAGASQVLRRIGQTASRLCASRPISPVDVRGEAFVNRCRTRAVGGAVAALAAPRVTAAYDRSKGRLKLAER